jgi:hypothetical protein
MSSITASYLKLFKNGSQLKSRYKKSEIVVHKKAAIFTFLFRHVIFKLR